MPRIRHIDQIIAKLREAEEALRSSEPQNEGWALGKPPF